MAKTVTKKEKEKEGSSELEVTVLGFPVLLCLPPKFMWVISLLFYQ